MTIAVSVVPQNGSYVASVLGSSELRADGPTRDAAVTALRAVIDACQTRGELLLLDIAAPAASEQMPPVSEEEATMWQEVVAEAYRYRDELKAHEFPE